VLPVTDNQNDYAREVVDRLASAGFRVKGDFRNEKLGYKIRESQLSKTPYALVIGEREATMRQVSPRRRGGEQLSPLEIDDFINILKDEIANPVSKGEKP